jgi:hypothetical protein
MQFEITDDAAISLTREFYSAIADGYPVDTALGEARKAIFAQGNELEWATPVLYMRSSNGRIFRMRSSLGTPGAATRPAAPAIPEAAAPGTERAEPETQVVPEATPPLTRREVATSPPIEAVAEATPATEPPPVEPTPPSTAIHPVEPKPRSSPVGRSDGKAALSGAPGPGYTVGRTRLGAGLAVAGAALTLALAWSATSSGFELWSVVDLFVVAVVAAVIGLRRFGTVASPSSGGQLIGLGSYAAIALLAVGWFVASRGSSVTGLDVLWSLGVPGLIVAGGTLLARTENQTAPGQLSDFMRWALPGGAAALVALWLPMIYLDQYKTLSEVASHFDGSVIPLIAHVVVVTAIAVLIPVLLQPRRRAIALGASAGLAIGLGGYALDGVSSALSEPTMPPPGSLLILLGAALILVGARRGLRRERGSVPG